jgi:hypothetical protein
MTTNGTTPTAPRTIVDAGISIPPLERPRAEDARIPDYIPDITHCDYLSQPFGAPCGAYTSATDGHVLSDDELFLQVIENWNARLSYGVFVPVPIHNMAYDQALAMLLDGLRGTHPEARIENETVRVIYDGGAWFVRIAWLHSPGPDGESFGSNNWTPARGAASAKWRREFDELNKDNPNWPGW